MTRGGWATGGSSETGHHGASSSAAGRYRGVRQRQWVRPDGILRVGMAALGCRLPGPLSENDEVRPCRTALVLTRVPGPTGTPSARFRARPPLLQRLEREIVRAATRVVLPGRFSLDVEGAAGTRQRELERARAARDCGPGAESSGRRSRSRSRRGRTGWPRPAPRSEIGERYGVPPGRASMTKLSPSLSPPTCPPWFCRPRSCSASPDRRDRQSGQNQTRSCRSDKYCRRIVGPGRHPDVEAAVALWVQLGPVPSRRPSGREFARLPARRVGHHRRLDDAQGCHADVGVLLRRRQALHLGNRSVP